MKTQVVNSPLEPLTVTVSGLQVGSTDPTKYIAVRLTNGTNFYTASSGGGSGGSSDSSDFDVEFPTFGVAAGFTNGTNLVSARAFDLDSGAGTQNVLGVSLRLSGNGGSVEFGTSSAPFRVDPTGTTPQPITDNGGSLTVDGTVNAAQSGAWNITNITGTVALPTGAATSALQTTGNTHLGTIAGAVSGSEVQVDVVTLPDLVITNIEDGAGDSVMDAVNNAIRVNVVAGSGSGGGGTEYTEGDTDASITGTAILWEDTGDTLRAVSATNPLPVEILGGSSSGTEYTEGDTDASITGTAMLMEGAANALVPAQGTVADGLLVNLGANNDVTVTGTVTANQGGIWDITDISGTISLPTGASTAANQVEIISNLETLAGAVVGTEVQVDVLTLPSVTISALPNEGQQTMANSISVAIASDQSAVPISNSSLTTIAGAVSGTEMQVDVLTMPTVTVQATNLDIRDLTNADVVTAELSAVDNAVLDAIAASLALLDNAVSGNELQVDVLTMPTVTIQDGGNTITVDGSVTVSATNLDIRDLAAASDSVAVHGDVGILDQLDLTNANPATVAIVDANGDQITSFGGGTQYTEGATDATITGTAILWEDTGDTLTPVSADAPLPVTVAGSTNIAKAEDAAHASGDVGVFMLGVRNDSASTSLTGTDGDYSAIAVNDKGAVWVAGIGTTVNVADGGSTISIDDGASSITVDNAALSVTGGGAEATALRVTIASDSTGVLSVDDNGNTLSVDDGAGSLTVDSAQLPSALVNGRLSVVADATGTLSNGAETAVSSSAVSVLAANANRKVAILQNTGSNNVRIGVTGVTATTGFRLTPGASLIFEPPFMTTQAIFAIRESADSTVLAMEIA